MKTGNIATRAMSKTMEAVRVAKQAVSASTGVVISTRFMANSLEIAPT